MGNNFTQSFSSRFAATATGDDESKESQLPKHATAALESCKRQPNKDFYLDLSSVLDICLIFL